MLRKVVFQVVLPFLAGVAIVVLYTAILWPVHSWLPTVPAEIIFYGSLPEEILKICVALLLIRWGMLPLSVAFVGLGFGFGEQAWFVLLFPNQVADILGPLAHGLSSLAMGIYLNKAYHLSRTRAAFWKYVLLGLFWAIVVHSAYNVIAIIVPPYFR